MMQRMIAMVAAMAAAGACLAETTRPKVEVAFVLDSTGSMGGLIEGAKQKIWSIANEFIDRKPSPELRIGLVTYRDRGDAYVVKRFDLTDDIDAVYSNLKTFTADGGGDGPESVNQALNEAVHQLSWNREENTLRVIFLVGDFPPHTDYANDVQYPVTCQAAARAGIIINTVQCGNESSCTPIWQEIARLSEGEYVQLSQTGEMVAVTTPYDAEIAKVSAELGTTVVSWGAPGRQMEVLAKAAGPATSMAPAVAAERAAFNLSSGGRAVQGRGDLVADIAEDKARLSEIKEDELPENMRKMTADERKGYLAEQQAKRTEINARLEKLSRQRLEHIEAEKRKTAGEAKADAFDAKVAEMVREQAARRLK